MNEQTTWIKYWLGNKLREYNTLLGLPAQKQKYNRKMIDTYETNDYIFNRIISGEPTMVARFGSSEGDITAETIGVNLKLKRRIRNIYLDNIHNNAGVFPFGEETAEQFGKLMIESVNNLDLLACWETYMQDYLINELCSNTITLTELKNIEPFFVDTPWTMALAGKRVVVIHPFKDSIEKQYIQRRKLFNNSKILPDFDLTVVKAVQTIANEQDKRFPSWFDALDYMYTESMKTDFDVAIIGCGAYGFPLAAKLKKAGKVAIHMGGVTQILFGIQGKRWDGDPYVSKLYNSFWTRPMESEMPVGAKKVENACYW